MDENEIIECKKIEWNTWRSKNELKITLYGKQSVLNICVKDKSIHACTWQKNGCKFKSMENGIIKEYKNNKNTMSELDRHF